MFSKELLLGMAATLFFSMAPQEAISQPELEDKANEPTVHIDFTKPYHDPRENPGNNRLNLKVGYKFDEKDLESHLETIKDGIEFSEKGKSTIIIDKAARQMTLYQNKKAVAQYQIRLSTEPYDDKQEEGDGRTPVGSYKISKINLNTVFHKALLLKYPNEKDQEEGKTGSLLQIHTGYDKTAGCIATNKENMNDLFNRLGLKDYRKMDEKDRQKQLSKVQVVIVPYGTLTNYTNL